MPQQRRHNMGARGTCICPSCGGNLLPREDSYHNHLLQQKRHP
jgi:hypothetical protein